jgi:hypothetical protein
MNTKRSLSRSLLLSILAGLVFASAAMASAGQLGLFQTSAVRQDTTACTPDDEGTSEDEATSPDETTSPDEAASPDEEAPGDEGDPEECEDPDEGDEATEPGDGDEATQPADPADREAECNEAAGISTPAEGEGGSEGGAEDGTEEEVKKGLDHAIEVVLANCIKNPQAPGLLNALRHLVANRDRQLAHKAELAARRAAREAAKAARRAAHASAHGKGA